MKSGGSSEEPSTAEDKMGSGQGQTGKGPVRKGREAGLEAERDKGVSARQLLCEEGPWLG